MPVLQTLRDQLVARRREGVGFEVAWRPAVVAALRGVGSAKERDAWETALTATADVWKSAYLGTPAPDRLRAARAIAEDRGLPVDTVARCAHCDGRMPEKKSSGVAATYCSEDCKRAARLARQRAVAEAVR
jgi:hypothetical protein